MTAVDRYVDRLLLELRGSARNVRRIMAEAEEHLRDATAEGVAAGLDGEEAQRRAVERFGPAVSRVEFVSALVRALVPTAAIGLVAVGVIAEVLGRLFGAAFVSGDPRSVHYTPERCAEFREYYPGHGCLTAAAPWALRSTT